MSRKWIVIVFVILFIISISSFAFAILNLNKDDNKLQEKAEEKLDYLENKIISMINGLNNITFSNSALNKTSEKTEESSDSESGNSASSSSSDSSSSESKSSESTESGSSQENENKTNKEQEKFEIKNQGILTSDLSKIDWNYIKNNTENIYSIWNTIIIDLHSLNVNNEDILNFSNSLDQVTLSVKNEDKITSLNNLANLYAYIPKYLEQFSKDDKKINLLYTKTCILNSYVLIEQEKWEDIKIQINNSLNYFSKVMNNIEQDDRYNQNKITKIYVSLNELNNTVNLQDKDLYYIKYKNAIEGLLNL